MYFQEVKEQGGAVLKISMIALGCFLAFMLIMLIFFWLPSLVLFLIATGTVLSTIAITTLPLYFFYRQVKKDVFTRDGAIVKGLLGWFVSYAILAICLAVVLNPIVKDTILFLKRSWFVTDGLYKLGFWLFPVAIVITFPVGAMIFYINRWYCKANN
jgi:hypothetical protein